LGTAPTAGPAIGYSEVAVDIVGATTFTVLMFYFDLVCNSENAACANFGEDPFYEVR
jgi:hypothetical protein